MIRKILGFFTLSAAMAALPALAEPITFGKFPAGALPKDFISALTGMGQKGRWQAVQDATAIDGRALAQLDPDTTDYRFPLAIYQPMLPSDVEVTIHFKPVSGKVDQAGGVAIRLKDAKNYYVVRANALEDNVRFYRVVAGNRQQIEGANVKVALAEWHTLTLRAQRDKFTVVYDGKLLFTATDKTFSAPGKAALWTKADSVTHFDRIEITPLQ